MKLAHAALALLALLAAAAPAPAQAKPAGKLWLYVGTPAGLVRLDFDGKSGKLGKPEPAAELADIAAVAVSDAGIQRPLMLYAVSADAAGKGAVTAFAVDAESGKLRRLNARPAGGPAPCRLALEPGGNTRRVYVSCADGTLAVIGTADDGSLEAKPEFVAPQSGPAAHPRGVAATNNGSVFVPHPDGVAGYSADQVTGKWAEYPKRMALPAKVAPGHLALGVGVRNFGVAYVTDQADSTLSVADLELAESGKPLQTLTTLPAGAKAAGAAPSALAVHPKGTHLFALNTGNDSLATFRIAKETGLLTPAGHTMLKPGAAPSALALDPAGDWLAVACRGADAVDVYQPTARAGLPRQTKYGAKVDRPACLAFCARP